jgi:crossover junction endodeoxyribonuclease RuvC
MAVTIMGIDPGTATTGFGVIRADRESCRLVAYGTIRTTQADTRADRLRIIHEKMSGLLLDHVPDMVVVEQLFFSRNVTTAMAVGEARGIVLLAAAQRGLPVHEYTPSAVKQSLSGWGRADKNEIKQMVAWALDLEKPPSPDDAADALAIALCHLYQVRLERDLGVTA